MYIHANCLAQIESDWTLRDGVNSIISDISGTKQSNLLAVFILQTYNASGRLWANVV